MKLDDVLFLEVDHVLLAHEEGLRIAGGLHGVRDWGLLESAVLAPRSGYYGTIAELAAVYAYGIIKDHAFFDGNKRAALLSVGTFLRANGFHVTFDVDCWADFLEAVANGKLRRDELALLFAIAMGEPGNIEE